MMADDDVDVFDLPVSYDPPDYSKREYLLLQIRQKDAIIESLLKQVSARNDFTPSMIADEGLPL